MGALHVRQAHPADLDVLVQELGQRPLFEDRLARQDKELGVLLTAWLGSAPIGVIYLWLEEAEEAELRHHLPGTPILNHLEILPGHRGRGIGTMLITAAEGRLRERGHHQVALAVEESNVRAARLYERLGYVPWPHPKIRCLSLTDGTGERQVEICQIMVKTLVRQV
jgi:GNAT superfamily N-acetyltransferase